MELVLNKEKFDYLHTSYRTCIAQEETAEAIVPDTQPDILRIIDVCALPLLKSKDAEPGKVSVRGAIQTTVLYLAEDGGLYKIEVPVSYAVSSASQDITGDSSVIAQIKVDGVDAAVANPRKIVVKVNITVKIKCFDSASAELCTGIEDARVFQRRKKTSVSTAAECGEKTFIVADELQIPETLPGADEILCSEFKLKCTDYSFAGKKLIIRGTLETELCWLPVDGSRPRKKLFSSDFSQMMDTELGYEGAKADISIMITSGFADFNTYSQKASDRELVVEVHAVTQFEIFPEREITFVGDMYSNDGELEITGENISGIEPVITEKYATRMREEIRCSTPGEELISAKMRFGDPVYNENGYKLSVYISVAYFDIKGEATSVKGTVTTAFECGRLGGELWAEAENIAVSFGGEAIIVSADITLCDAVTSVQTVNNITGVSLEESEDRGEMPSIIVYRAKEGDSVWELAKKYHSSCNNITMVNGIEEEAIPEVGQILLIPKA